MLTDTHLHLDFPEFDADREAVLARAKEKEIGLLINAGADLETSRRSLELAETYDFIYGTAGVHPHDAAEVSEEVMREIEGLLSRPEVIAVGEVGLDFYRNLSSPEVQKAVFRGFVKLSLKTDKPLVIHCRDAYDDLIRILSETGKPPWRGVMHCFSADAAVMDRFLDLGFYIAFGGALTYKKNDGLREACRRCPLDRLLLETDAPYLAPQSKRGKRNEPAYLVETAALAAKLHRVSLDVMGSRTTENAKKVFKLC